MQIIFKLCYEALKLAKSPAPGLDLSTFEPLQTPPIHGTILHSNFVVTFYGAGGGCCWQVVERVKE